MVDVLGDFAQVSDRLLLFDETVAQARLQTIEGVRGAAGFIF